MDPRTERADVLMRTSGTSGAASREAAELTRDLDRFKRELRAAGLRESTIHSYLMGSTLFVRWLAGDYTPGPGRAGRVVA